MTISTDVLDLPMGVTPDPEEFLRAAMEWHFNPATGSPFWVERAHSLDFDPRSDVRGLEDLRLFPNVTDELRDVPTEQLIPRGFGNRPEIVGVVESGGTTGAPKRLPMLKEFADRLAASERAVLTESGVSRTGNWLSLFPSGPHGAFEQMKRAATAFGDGILVFGIDLDPRWVKKQISAGRRQVAAEYVDHIVEQAAFVLESQNVSMLRLTSPILAELVRRDDLVELIREKITHIGWGGAHMDAESRHFYRTEVFPHIELSGRYGTTMALGGGGVERRALEDGACIFDPTVSPNVFFSVIDPETSDVVPYGEVGQVVVNHVSRSFLLPNNDERDLGTRVEQTGDRFGDSVADIHPMPSFSGATVIEGVY
jgi:phenylacetate-coenzyme A ligase PaaK-like adenylate-forming protein